MKKKSSSSLFFKSISAGRKTLWSRILVFSGTAIAVFQFIDTVSQQKTVNSILTSFPVYNTYIKPVFGNVAYYIIAAVLLALIRHSSFTNYSKKIKGTDIKIGVKVGDIFQFKGGIIVPSNTTFINDTEIIGDKSIQAQIVRKCNSGEFSSEISVEDQLSHQLMGNNQLSDARTSTEPIELNGREYDQYEYGTLVPVTLNTAKATKNFYYLSMSKINNPKIPVTSDLDLSESIDKMWKNANDFVSDSSLASPVIATGAAKFFEIPAEVIARYILKSFANYACSKNARINDFTLIINPNDYLEDKYNLEELHNFIDYLCKFPKNETELIKDLQSKKTSI